MAIEHYLTHISRQRSEKYRWVILPFISQREGIEGYFYGIEETILYPKDFIEEQVKRGAIQEVPRTLLPETKGIWLAPDGKVYLANYKDPIGDSSKLELTTISFR